MSWFLGSGNGGAGSKSPTRTANEEELGKFGTSVVHSHGSDPLTGALIPPINLSTTFEQKSPGVPIGDFEYSRSGNPTRRLLEETLAKLEHGTFGLAFASGLAALTTIVGMLRVDDHVMMVNDVYGGTYRYFTKVAVPRMGLQMTIIPMHDASTVATHIRPNTKIVWLETPTNPTLTIVDIAAISKAVKEKQPSTLIIVDNTFLTPYFQLPLELGADLVVHSVTKYLNGHCDVVMGAVVGKCPNLKEQLSYLQNSLGTVPSPFDCYLVLRGLKTLHLRMERHAKNAHQVATFLSTHPKVEWVSYPGLPSHPQHHLALKQQRGHGGMVSFRLKGDLLAACKFTKATKLFALAESLGGVESLIELPSIMTHGSVTATDREALGITDTFIRLSCGIEDGNDLVNDLRGAFEQI